MNKKSTMIMCTIDDELYDSLLKKGFSITLKSKPNMVDPMDEKFNPEHYDSGCPQSDSWYYELKK